MEVITLFNNYQIPISVVTTIVLMWATSKFIFPFLPNLSKWIDGGKSDQIKDLKTRIDELEKTLSITQAKGNQMIGLLRGLSFQLKELGIEIDEEIDKIIDHSE